MLVSTVRPSLEAIRWARRLDRRHEADLVERRRAQLDDQRAQVRDLDRRSARRRSATAARSRSSSCRGAPTTAASAGRPGPAASRRAARAPSAGAPARMPRCCDAAGPRRPTWRCAQRPRRVGREGLEQARVLGRELGAAGLVGRDQDAERPGTEDQRHEQRALGAQIELRRETITRLETSATRSGRSDCKHLSRDRALDRHARALQQP